MSPRIVRTVTLLGLLCSLASTRRLGAQEFRVYTAVSDLSREGAPRVVARSLTLFHAGNVYDHMEEAGELVIFEPIHDRFVIIRDSTAAVVPFEELRQLLDVASAEAGKYADELRARGDRDSLRTRSQLLFQLQPDFRPHLEPAARMLTLRGTEFSYDVRTDLAPSPTIVQQYLAYADWAARLNTVLHSQSMFPSPRLSLNETLRQQGELPVSVLLQSRDPRELRLRADHEYRWQLQTIDKDLIHQWETLRRSDQLQWVSFREYQQRLVAASRR
jgi:hypothetical protein